MTNASALSQTGDSTSRSLLRRARDGEPTAWERLSHIYTPLVYQWCRHTGLSADDAADLVQEVFRALAVSLPGFRHRRAGDSFRAWLWAVTRSKILDFGRRQARQPQAAGGSDVLYQLEEIPDQTPEADDAHHARAALAQRAMAILQGDFQEQTWLAFWKTAVEEKTAPQAAEELGMSVAAVYMARCRVLRRLRQELDGLGLFE